ncbi:MAG: hypothetical protein H8K04_08520 [Nitrospira sp.]
MIEDGDGKPAQTDPSINSPSPIEPPQQEAVELPIVKTHQEKTATHADKSHQAASIRDKALVDRIQKSDVWMIVLTAIMAISAAAQVVIYCFQAKDSSMQTDRIISEATRMANSLEATVERNKIMLDEYRQSAQIDQRAWIGFALATTPQVKPNARLVTEVQVANTGRTPARKMHGHVVSRVLSKSEPFSPVYPKPDDKPGLGVVQPGGLVSWHIRVSAGLTQDEIDEFANGDKIMYVFGKFNYEDIFKQPHRTTFCVYFSPHFEAAKTCHTYNEAD